MKKQTLKTTVDSIRSKYIFLTISNPVSSPHVIIVSLNRPLKRNAINAQMWREIGDVFSQLGGIGDGCRCILLNGSGKSFSAGIDISEESFSPKEGDAGDVAHQGISFLPKIREMQRCFTELENCPVPIVAAIHGSCIGAGIDLACCCDIRLCAQGTIFSVREVKLGLAADVGTLQRLPKITGNDSRVRELCYTGEDFDEREALRMGFVSRISQNVLADGMELCQKIAENSPVAVLGTKRSLIFSRDHGVSDGLEHIASHNALALMTDDLQASFIATATKSKAEYQNLPRLSKL